MPNTILTTRRLRLRSWLMSDVAAYHKHCNTEPVMQFLGGVMPRSHVRAEVRWLQQHEQQHGHTFWVVERKHDRELLGFCGLIRIPDRGSVLEGKLEIGWRIRADMWRRGYGFEAAEAVMAWAASNVDDRYVWSRIDRGNVASQALARKLGMRRDRKVEQAMLEAGKGDCVLKIRCGLLR